MELLLYLNFTKPSISAESNAKSLLFILFSNNSIYCILQNQSVNVLKEKHRSFEKDCFPHTFFFKQSLTNYSLQSALPPHGLWSLRATLLQAELHRCRPQAPKVYNMYLLAIYRKNLSNIRSLLHNINISFSYYIEKSYFHLLFLPYSSLFLSLFLHPYLSHSPSLFLSLLKDKPMKAGVLSSFCQMDSMHLRECIVVVAVQ